jgi:RNA-directed DNA polymerase
VHLAFAWEAAGATRPDPDGESKPDAAPTRPGALAHPMMEEVVEAANLRCALKRVRANNGSPGVDGMTTQELPAYLKAAWPRLREELLVGTYRPQPVKRAEIPKPGGGVRALGIPVWRSYGTSIQAA